MENISNGEFSGMEGNGIRCYGNRIYRNQLLPVTDGIFPLRQNRTAHSNIRDKRAVCGNTALIEMVGKNDRKLSVQASSLGGGRIMVNKIDGIDVNFSAEKPTLIVHNIDQPGHVAEVTSMLSHKCVNIATMQLFRDKRGGYAVMVLETDQQIPEESIKWLEHLEGVIKVTYVNIME